MASVALAMSTRSVPDSRRARPLIFSSSSAFLERDYSRWRVPAGTFISNAFATNGPNAYGAQVKFLTGLPFVLVLEIVGIYIPLLYHSLYGFYIWFRGKSNVSDYPWAGNFMYSAQRWTGAIAFVYIIWHTYTMRFTGMHLLSIPSSLYKVQMELQHWWAGVFYLIGIIAASWHFAYGIYLFCAKWGITVSERSRKWLGPGMYCACAYFDYRGMASPWRHSSRSSGETIGKIAPATEQSMESETVK